MSNSVTKWVRDYLIGIGTEYGGILDSRIPPWPMKDKKNCQIVQFLTYGDTSGDNCIWAVISDKKYYISVKFTAKALDEYNNNPNNRGKRFTECKGALISIACFTPCFRRVAVQSEKKMSSEETISLDVNFVKVLGSYNESLWGSPLSVDKDGELGQWIVELRKDNGNINLFRDRLEKDQQGVQEKIDKFNDFSTVAVGPSHIRISPQPQKKQQNTSKPTRPKQERTPLQLYNKKWRKLLGDTRRSFEQARIPQEAKLQLANTERTTKPAIRNRDPLGFDSSQATRRSASPHTPRPTTPLSEEWPPTQVYDGASSEGTIAVETDSDNYREHSSSAGTTPVEDSEPEGEQEETELSGKLDLTAETKSSDVKIVVDSQLSPSTGHPGSPPALTSPVHPGSIVRSPEGRHNAPDYSVATPRSPALPSSSPDRRDPVSTVEVLESPGSQINNRNTSSIVGLISPLSTPGKVIIQYPMPSSQQIQFSLPTSSLPLPSTLNKTFDDSEVSLPPHGPNHYNDMVNRKVPTPNQGPPIGTYRYKQSDGKILVPASDSSRNASQSQPQLFCQSQDNLSGRSDYRQPQSLQDEEDSKGKQRDATHTKSSSLPPTEFTRDDNDQSGDEDTETDEEEKDELDHGNASNRGGSKSDDTDRDDQFITRKLNEARPTNLSTPHNSILKGKMTEVHYQNQRHARLCSPSVEIIPSKHSPPRQISSTHDPRAWLRPSFQTKDKGKGRELPASGVGNVSGRKRNASAMYSGEEGDDRAVRRQKIHCDSRRTNDQNAVVIAKGLGHQVKPPDVKLRSSLSKVGSNPGLTSRTHDSRASVASRRDGKMDVDDGDSYRRVNHSRGKLAGLKIAFNISPSEGIPLLTQGSVGDILLRTGRNRYKEAKAKRHA